MADSVSIVMTMKTDIAEKLKTIASTSHGCSKEFEEIQRRATELIGKTESLNTRYESFNKKSAEAATRAEKLKLEMSEMTKAARKSGQELDEVSFNNLKKEYREAADSAKGYANAAKDTLKEMKLIEDEARTLELAESELPGLGMAGASNSGGFISKLFSGDIGGKLAQSGLYQMIGDSASSVIGTLAESALGQPLASLGGSIISGAASGASAGALLGPWGSLAGAGIGAFTGLINGGNQIYQEQDDAFKDYYRSLYEDTNTATAERLSSGSTLAAGRETTKLSFNTLLGDDKKAGAFLEQVQDTANTTPFLYDDLVGVSKTLLSFGMAVDDIIPTLTKVGDAGAALGLTAGDIGTVSTYLGRMQSSDKASLEYLNPLNERGFSVFQWLADDLNKKEGGILQADRSRLDKGESFAVGDVYEMISKGTLSGAEVSQVILEQFGALYGGMMDVQSKSTEGLDSTLQGLKENVDAAGGERYNDMRNASKERDIAAYGGYLGDKLAELSAVGGEVQAYGENLKEQFQREALEAVLTRTIDREKTVFSEEDTEKLVELSAQYREAEEAYKHGSMEAGQKMVDLREEAEALATAAYESSEWAQSMRDAEIEQIDATRELTKTMVSATDAWRTNNAFSKGGMAGNPVLKFFGIGRSAEEQQKSMDDLRELGLYAYGLDYVPYDEFPALLHQGERVLTAAEAREMDRGVLSGAAELGADKRRSPEDWAAGTFAFGLRRTPYEDFPALLHQGERVLSPAEARGMDVFAAAAPLGADKQFLQNEGNGADALPDRTLERSAVPLEEAIWGPRETDDLWSAETRAGSPPGGARGSEPNLFHQSGGDIHLTVHVEAINVQGGADADFVDEIAEALLQKIKIAELRSGE